MTILIERIESTGPRWQIGYIDDAATYRTTVTSPAGFVHTDVSNYNPPRIGINLCGQTDDGEQPTTVAAYRMASASEARSLWNMAKSVAECGEGEGDFIVELLIDHDTYDDFWSNRQMWPRAIEAWNAASLRVRGVE